MMLLGCLASLRLAHAEDEITRPDAPWPQGIVFVSDDCSLYSPGQPGNALHSLSVTVFTVRQSRAFPEHDLPSPVKVGRKLMALRPAKPGTEPVTLVDAGLGALGSPSVSFDGRWVYFSMARAGEPFFHIYRIAADQPPGGDHQPEQLTDGPFHDIDPAELPDGRIVFASTRIGYFDEYHSAPARALYVIGADGSGIEPVTHTINFDNEPEVMADGRIVLIRTDNLFDRAKVETRLHAMRPDGTQGETAFGLNNAPEYGNRLRAFVCGSPAPLPDGRVAFVSEPGITLGRPGEPPQYWQHLRAPFGDVAALPDGRLLCTHGENGKYEQIQVVESETADAVTVYESLGQALHSPTYLGERPRPPVLPATIKTTAADNPSATGILFCQNARLSQHTSAGWPHIRAIRVIASKGQTTRSSHSYIVHAGSEAVELGTVPLAPDGSFAVEVPADTPIAFQAVDAEGRAELNEMSWIYVRPGERRGCVGCHERRDAAPGLDAPDIMALRAEPLKLTGEGAPPRFRGNNAAVTGLMELQFDRFREVAGIDRHGRAAGTSAETIHELIAGLRSQTPALRTSAAQRLAIFRERAAAPELAALLDDPSREVRVAAAVALAACGTRESVEPLLDALDDRDPVAAHAAAMALENLTAHAEPFNAFARAAPGGESRRWRQWFAQSSWGQIETTLLQQLESSDRDLVRRAAEAMGHVGGEAASADLRAYVDRERRNNPYPEWRQTHRGDGTRFNALDAANPRTLQAAVRALGALRDAQAAPLLAETIAQHNDPVAGNLFVVEAAAEALGRIGTPEAEAALLSALAGLGDYWNYNLWYGDHDALIACHASPPHFRVIEALDAVGSTLDQVHVPSLLRTLPTDPDRALLQETDDYEALVGQLIRRAGAEPLVVETCLAILGEPEAQRSAPIEEVIGHVHPAWAGTPNTVIRAAQILSVVARDAAWEPRIRAAFDRFRREPVDIKRVFDEGIPVVTRLPEKHWVCFYLARTMGELGDSASVPSLIEALEAPAEAAPGHPDPLGPGVLFLHNDLTPCWRAAAAAALGRIGDRRAMPALMATVRDLSNATDTRQAAAGALKRLATPADVGAIEELAGNYPELSTRKVLLSIVAAARE